MPTIAPVGAATDEVTVVAVAAIGICPAVMPERPVPPPVIVWQPKPVVVDQFSAWLESPQVDPKAAKVGN